MVVFIYVMEERSHYRLKKKLLGNKQPKNEFKEDVRIVEQSVQWSLFVKHELKLYRYEVCAAIYGQVVSSHKILSEKRFYFFSVCIGLRMRNMFFVWRSGFLIIYYVLLVWAPIFRLYTLGSIHQTSRVSAYFSIYIACFF